ncbi:MAG: aldo/keto reductase [Deltaproteobacteria bacterium]|uniref:aldo/keto reductase n=1 Tax=Hydrosulfovibrio ferrireducens TaxID=2934181 RepID=UPI0012037655|nr:MAG: aldo/keto reductase [Deltaproteobacteria bacterium]
MQYNYIGKSGLRVSNICMGTMTFGKKCDKKISFEILEKAYANGVNFYDTAEVYPVPPTAETYGITEEIFGEWLAGKPRDAIIVATKVAGAANGWFVPPVRHGLTAIDAFHITTAVEGSLRRLKTDYLDLYQVHWPDTVVPIEESLEALDQLVRSGKVRYIGTSNENAYGLTKALETSRYRGFKRFESIQNNFSMLNRRFLDEIAIVCKKEQVGLLPFSPLAGGVLSGKYKSDRHWDGFRFGDYLNNPDPRMQAQAGRFAGDRSIAAAQKYAAIAIKHGLAPATMAAAWTLSFDFVPSTIVGATHPSQLDDTLRASETVLSQELLKECDSVNQEILYPMG